MSGKWICRKRLRRQQACVHINAAQTACSFNSPMPSAEVSTLDYTVSDVLKISQLQKIEESTRPSLQLNNLSLFIAKHTHPKFEKQRCVVSFLL